MQGARFIRRAANVTLICYLIPPISVAGEPNLYLSAKPAMLVATRHTSTPNSEAGCPNPRSGFAVFVCIRR